MRDFTRANGPDVKPAPVVQLLTDKSNGIPVGRAMLIGPNARYIVRDVQELKEQPEKVLLILSKDLRTRKERRRG